MLSSKELKIRWLYLIMGSVTMLLGGIIYSWSILKSPLTDEFSWNPAQLALNFTITLCCFGIGGLISGVISDRTTPRIRLIISALLVFFGYLMASRINENGLLLLYFAYGVLGGFGIGILYNTTISTVSKWFPDKRGLCSGIILMCFGFSTLLFGGLAGHLIAMPDFGWRKTYLLLGTCMAIVVLIFGVLIKVPTEIKIRSGQSADDDNDMTAAQMLRTATFWKLVIALTLLSTIGNSTISFAKDFAVFTGSRETLAIAIVGILSVCNGFARICAGAIYDRISLRKTQWFIVVVMLIAPLIGILSLITGSQILGIICLLLCGFSYGLCPTTSAVYPRIFFGEKHYALNFSITNLTLIPTSFVATLSGVILTKTGSFMPVFEMLLAFAVIGSISLLLIKPKDS